MIGVSKKKKTPKAAAATPLQEQVSLPELEQEPTLESLRASSTNDDADDAASDNESISSDGTVRATTTSREPIRRQKNESKDEKRARKHAVKAERSARRTEKKARQETFGNERRQQIKGHERAVGAGRASDLTALASGGTGAVNVVRL